MAPPPLGIHALVQPPPLDPVTPLTQPKQCTGLGPWAYDLSTQAPAFGSMFCCHCLEISSLDGKWSPVTAEHASAEETHSVCLPPSWPPDSHLVHAPWARVSAAPWYTVAQWDQDKSRGSGLLLHLSLKRHPFHLHLNLLRAQEEGSCIPVAQMTKKLDHTIFFFFLMFLPWISQPLVLKNNP